MFEIINNFKIRRKWEEEKHQAQEGVLRMEEVSERKLNKTLYKLFLVILKVIPFILALNETIFTIIHYYDIECYSLNFIGGFSLLFIIQLYILSYILQYCKWHRVPLHYVTIVNILALYDTYIGIPISDL